MTKQSIIGYYFGLDAKKRVDFLIEHYRDFEFFHSAYKESIISIMLGIREWHENKSGDLGVRIQTSGGNSDVTFYKACERIDVAKCFENLEIATELFKEKNDLELVRKGVSEWKLMRREFDTLNSFISLLAPVDRRIYTPYLLREKRLIDIAEELCIELESANKRIYRIRKKLISSIIPVMENVA